MMTIKGKEDVNMDINTFDILLVDFGEIEFCGEQAGVRPAIVIQNAMWKSCSREYYLAGFIKNETRNI